MTKVTARDWIVDNQAVLGFRPPLELDTLGQGGMPGTVYFGRHSLCQEFAEEGLYIYHFGAQFWHGHRERAQIYGYVFTSRDWVGQSDSLIYQACDSAGEEVAGIARGVLDAGLGEKLFTPDGTTVFESFFFKARERVDARAAMFRSVAAALKRHRKRLARAMFMIGGFRGRRHSMAARRSFEKNFDAAKLARISRMLSPRAGEIQDDMLNEAQYLTNGQQLRELGRRLCED